MPSAKNSKKGPLGTAEQILHSFIRNEKALTLNLELTHSEPGEYRRHGLNALICELDPFKGGDVTLQVKKLLRDAKKFGATNFASYMVLDRRWLIRHIIELWRDTDAERAKSGDDIKNI
jgi:hypothetical protein